MNFIFGLRKQMIETNSSCRHYSNASVLHIDDIFKFWPERKCGDKRSLKLSRASLCSLVCWTIKNKENPIELKIN